MKKYTIIIMLLLINSSIQAQQTNASAGGNATGSGGSVSYTIGQQEYSSFSSVGGSVNQGVQQPQEFFGTNCTPTTSTTNISIYPTSLPYTWNGLTFLASGTQTAHLTNAAGCDSAASLTLTVNNAATAKTLFISKLDTCNGGKAIAKVYMKNFINVSGFQGSINFDRTKLSVLTPNDGIGNVGFSYKDTAVGRLGFLFTNPLGQGETYTDSTVAFSVTFNVLGGYIGKSDITFSSLPTAQEIDTIDVSTQLPDAIYDTSYVGGYINFKGLVSASTTNTIICPTALPYSWNGLTFNAAGSQTKHLTNAAGCDSAATLNLSITAQPTPAANNVCVGGTIQLTNATSGGVWASVNNRATVNATGLVTGANAGGAVITYKKNGVTTTYNITVNAIPAVPSIVYAAGAINPQLGASRGAFCINKTFGIVGIPAGGVFTTGNNAIVTINCSGTVNTVGLGNSYINYRYTNAQGCSNSRTMVGVVVNCAARGVNTAEGQLSTVNDFTIYPNPAKSIVNLNIDFLVGSGSIVVTDLYGKIIKTQTLSMGTNTIDVANLSKGIYFVSTITNEGKTTKKLVVE